MTDDLFRYYESELFFIRRLAHEFAAKHPEAAARLRLEQTASPDPHVERLIEAFAVLAARVRHKLDDEFPELTDAVLSVVYPHALAPVPSFATAQFEVHPSHAKPEGVAVPAGSPLHTARVGEQFCKYRTCYPTTLWPVAVAGATLHPPPFPPGLSPPVRATAALRLRLRSTVPEMPLAAQSFDLLRFHLLGETALVGPLYDLLFNHALEVAFVDPERPKAAVSFPADRVLRPVGFDPDHGLIPYPPTVFPGYRLLTEYFAYPAKFLYLDVGGFGDVRRAVAPTGQLDVVVFLDRSHPRLEQLLDAGLFRLGCTPLANLFEWDSAEPIQLTHTRTEYPVVPKQGQPLGFEVHSVLSVTAAGPAGAREYQPFYHYRHGGDRTNTTAFWYATRRPSVRADDRGTDVYLHLVDTAFRPAEATDEAVDVRLLCTNRDLPGKLPRVGEFVRFDPAFAASGLTVRCVRNPTGALRPAGPRGRFWHLISHLNLNHLSLTEDGGLDALKGILRLYDLTDPNAEPQAAALARQSIDGLLRVGHRRAVAWLGGGETAGLVRGIEVELELDEAKYTAGGLLFASVLERFFALTVSVNSFSRLAVRYRQREGVLKRWPPRAGDKPLG
jgi:type VI secretion system protein ImpG